MKKFFLSSAVIAVSAVYAVYQYMGGGSVAALASATTTTTNQSPGTATSQTPPQTQTSTPAPAPAPTHTPTPTQTPQGQYVDGTYTGSPADAYYGMVQIQATISGGKLAGVAFLQYPNTHSTSVYINDQAMPLLQSEAIQAQSANVNIVSGATFTSQAFQQSLQSALQQAKA